MKLYNSLTRKVEEFVPLNPPKVGMYTCGPTVYDRKHIGNFRTYNTADIIVRMLKAQGCDVIHIMNLTDVGHLTGDNLGDADIGEDRIEIAAKRERKTVWDVAQEYSDLFLADFKKLNLLPPQKFTKATDHINEQIQLIEKLEENGLIYVISDGIYFDTVEYEKKTGKRYGELTTLDEIKEGARVEPNPEKKNPRDFALWRLSPKGEARDMEWDSPWGKGFPGWHLECSAMSMKYLGESFDIHIGGVDLRQTHHPNEIAQSEGATGKKFVNYWVHGEFILIDGEKMSSSKRNVYTLGDIEEKGFDLMALRYLYLTTHYRQIMNFTWESLKAAQTAYEKLVNAISEDKGDRKVLSEDKLQLIEAYRVEFFNQLKNDLGTPQALAILWEVLKSNIPLEDKKDLVLEFDEVLGLGLQRIPQVSRIPREIEELMKKRETLRQEKQWDQADKVREQIEDLGYIVEDMKKGPRVKPKHKYNL